MMNVRLLFLCVLAGASSPVLAQTLTEQAAATGIASGLHSKASPNGLAAAKKARAITGRSDDPFGQPTPGERLPKAGAASPHAGTAGPSSAPTPAAKPEPQPWTWRLKGTVDNGEATPLALFVGPDGSLVRMRAGARFDERSRLLKITKMHIVVELDGKRHRFYPW